MTISEKVAYIQGLFDGMGLDKSESGEAKVLSEMLDVLKEVADQLETVDSTLDEFGEEIDAISDDLADVEEFVFDDEDEDDDDEDGEELDEDFFEVACPNCGEDLVIDDAVLEAGSIDCPVCGQKFALSFEDEDGCECDCGCDHDHAHEKPSKNPAAGKPAAGFFVFHLTGWSCYSGCRKYTMSRSWTPPSKMGWS